MAKIMLVEDDNNLREIYGARLMAEGYEIVSAQDGEEALAIAVKEKPDLIISDVMMPRISGFDMLDILRNAPETKDTKVIMMTALSQAEDKSRADKLGADRYLVKSQVTLEDVTNVVHEVLGDVSDDTAAPSSEAPEATPPPATVASAPSIDSAPQPAEVVATPPAEPPVIPSAEATPPAPSTPTVEAIANPDIKIVDEPNPGEVQAPPAEAIETATPAPAGGPAVQPPVIPAPNPAQFQPGPGTPTPTIPPVSDDSPATDDPQATASGQAAPPVPAPEPPANDAALPPVVEPAKTEEVKPADIKVELPAPDTSPAPAPDTPPVDSAPVEAVASEPSVGPNLAEALAAEEQQVSSDKSSADISPPTTTPEPTAPTIANGASSPTVVAPTKIEITTPEEATTPEESTNPSTPDKKATGERVIQPLNDPSDKPDLQALLAAEEEKEAVSNPAVNSVIPPQGQDENPSKPSTDLNNIAI